MNKETALQNAIRVALSSEGCAVFRRNHGLYYTVDGRPVKIGVDGEADLSGHTQTGRAWYIEVKKPGESPRKDQQRFLDAMVASGALAGVAHSVEEALMIIKGNHVEITSDEDFKRLVGVYMGPEAAKYLDEILKELRELKENVR